MTQTEENAKRYTEWRDLNWYSKFHQQEWDEYLDKLIEEKEKKRAGSHDT